MALALVKLSVQRNGKTHHFLDYISYEIARLGVQIQGEEHKVGEYSKAEIVKVINNVQKTKTK